LFLSGTQIVSFVQSVGHIFFTTARWMPTDHQGKFCQSGQMNSFWIDKYEHYNFTVKCKFMGFENLFLKKILSAVTKPLFFKSATISQGKYKTNYNKSLKFQQLKITRLGIEILHIQPIKLLILCKTLNYSNELIL